MVKFLALPMILAIISLFLYLYWSEVITFVSKYRAPILVVSGAFAIGLTGVYLLYGINFNIF